MTEENLKNLYKVRTKKAESEISSKSDNKFSRPNLAPKVVTKKEGSRNYKPTTKGAPSDPKKQNNNKVLI